MDTPPLSLESDKESIPAPGINLNAANPRSDPSTVNTLPKPPSPSPDLKQDDTRDQESRKVDQGVIRY